MNADESSATLVRLPAAPVWPGRHRIGSFELQSVLTQGEAGLVYRAWDHALSRPVAIKEYLPAALARRDANGDVQVLGADAGARFERGRHAFIDEARLLGRCDHPSLVRVLDLLEAHGTAYRVMPWYSGRTLLDVRRKMAGPLGEQALRLLLDHLLGALDEYQRVGGVHRAVSAQQTMLLDDGRALLLGPGAASRALQVGAVDAPVQPPNPGFAPPEQASLSNGQAQGPWTDFYALAALARFCITGTLPGAGEGAPPQGEAPAMADGAALADLPALRHGTELLRVLDAALSADTAKRPQTAAEFRDRLLRSQAPRPATVIAPAQPDAAAPVAAAAAVGADAVDAGDSAAAPTAPARDVLPVVLLPDDRDDRAADAAARRGRRPWRPVAALAVALAVAVGVGAWQLQAPPYRVTVAALTALTAFATPHEAAQVPGPVPSPEATQPAEQAPASVSVPMTEAAAVPVPVPAPQPMAAPPTRAAPIGREAERPASPRSAAAAPPGPGAAGATPKAPAAQSAPTVRRGAPEAVATLAAAAVAAGSPRQECGARTEFSLYRCMQQQCSQPRWQRHAQCVRLEETDSVE